VDTILDVRAMKILIIDDHAAFREEVQRILLKNGHEVTGVDNAAGAVPLVESGVFQLVLLDYNLPGLDGLWLLRTARIPRQTKVLLVTAHTHPTLIQTMFRAGVAGYLLKPFDEDDLLRHLEFHFHDRARPSSVTEPGLR